MSTSGPLYLLAVLANYDTLLIFSQLFTIAGCVGFLLYEGRAPSRNMTPGDNIAADSMAVQWPRNSGVHTSNLPLSKLSGFHIERSLDLCSPHVAHRE